jgi:hypothetical protein
MRRLALVRLTGLNPVIITDRDVQLFLHIPIEIPKKKTEAAVRILEPTLIGGRHVLTRGVQRLHGQLSGLPVHGQRRPHEPPACEQDCKTQSRHRQPHSVHTEPTARMRKPGRVQVSAGQPETDSIFAHQRVETGVRPAALARRPDIRVFMSFTDITCAVDAARITIVAWWTSAAGIAPNPRSG